MGRSGTSSESSYSYPSSESSNNDRRRGGGKRNRSRSREYETTRNYPKRSPQDTPCQICKKKNHWTIECDSIERDPSRYPDIDRRNGCPICGKVGHRWNRCHNVKYSCESCGDLHASRECPYNYEPVEYHEFFDEAKGHPFFYCCKDKSISWAYKGKKLDKLLWHCNACRVLLPTEVPECVICHAPRMRKAKDPKVGAAASTKERPAAAERGTSRRNSKHVASKSAGEEGNRNEKDLQDVDEQYEAAKNNASAKSNEPAPGEGLTFAAISGWIDETNSYTN